MSVMDDLRFAFHGDRRDQGRVVAAEFGSVAQGAAWAAEALRDRGIEPSDQARVVAALRAARPELTPATARFLVCRCASDLAS